MPVTSVPMFDVAGVDVSLPVLNPMTPPTGLVVFAPSAPKVSGVPSVRTLPVAVSPSLTEFVFAVAVGVSSVIVIVTVLFTALP